MSGNDCVRKARHIDETAEVHSAIGSHFAPPSQIRNTSRSAALATVNAP